jgi:hypothetical protein
MSFAVPPVSYVKGKSLTTVIEECEKDENLRLVFEYTEFFRKHGHEFSRAEFREAFEAKQGEFLYNHFDWVRIKKEKFPSENKYNTSDFYDQQHLARRETFNYVIRMIRADWFVIRYDGKLNTITEKPRKIDYTETTELKAEYVPIDGKNCYRMYDFTFPNSIVTLSSTVGGLKYGRDNTHVAFAFHPNSSYPRIYFCGNMEALEIFFMQTGFYHKGCSAVFVGDGYQDPDLKKLFSDLIQTGKCVSNVGVPRHEQTIMLFELPN